jgi:hypothetical protein
VYRTKWGVKAVPQLVRYQRVDGEIKVTGRLVEDEEFAAEEKVVAFVNA